MIDAKRNKIWFLNKAKYFIVFSSLFILAGLIAGIINGGLNLGVDFTGGSLLNIEVNEVYDPQVITNALDKSGINTEDCQIIAAEDNTVAVIRMPVLSKDQDTSAIRDNILAAIRETYPNADAGNMETVGGVATGEIVMNAFMAVLIASVLTLVYVWIRFTLFPGIAGVIALLHDVLIMTAFVVIFQIQVNSTYIAACLTIIGYSINDTIVVFDRIRENNRKYDISTVSRTSIADAAIRETLPRTINTFVTSLITATAVYVFGVESIREFSLPLIVGLISGFYSSIFIATPLWIALANIRAKKSQKKLAEQKA
jgi:protein-export membrane protein SecF